MIKELKDRIDRYQTIINNIRSVPKEIDESVSRNKDVLLSLNRDQMLLGRNAQGDLFTPTYLNDPYFKTKKRAEAYANMKYKLESGHKSLLWNNEQVYSNKPKDTPNLIVTGPFQNAMFITIGVGS